MSELSPTVGEVIEGPFESRRVHNGWFWQRPNGAGDLGYNRPDVLLRCARIFGGRVVVYRTDTHTTTTVHVVTPPTPSPDDLSCVAGEGGGGL